MDVSQMQLAVIIAGVGAVIGARRGWARELITCAIVLGTLLFLLLGGLNAVSNVFSGVFASMGGGSANCAVRGPTSATMSPDPPQPLSDLMFAGMTWLGYAVGRQHGAEAVSFNHRLMGMIPGAITGGAIAYYLDNVLFPDGISVLQWLNNVDFASSLPVLLGFGIIGVLAVFLYTAKTGKGGGH